jgi:alkanesulfonate monooxygenase SsuD/methylene tetrahydromethanopterin reductase-like flavin-dependent oxidoreductase (luciferase family)
MSLTFGLVLDLATPARTIGEQIDRYREVIAAADRYGFDSITMGEGHSLRPQSGHTPAPLLVLAALAPTTRMRLGTGVTLLPSWHPLRLAYETAVLDQLSGGRLILGVGLGASDLARRYGVGVPIGEYADDVLAALRALWSGKPGFKGKHVSVEGGIGVSPVQRGGPPVWVGGSVQRSVDRAAELGDGYVGSTSQSFDQLAGLSERYRAALGARGKDPTTAVVASNRLTVLAETEAEARAAAVEPVGQVLAFYARRGAQMPDDPNIATKTPAQLFDELDETRCLVGTPERVAERLRRYEQAGVTHILARLIPHDIDPEHAVRTVELLGQRVMPEFARK